MKLECDVSQECGIVTHDKNRTPSQADTRALGIILGFSEITECLDQWMVYLLNTSPVVVFWLESLTIVNNSVGPNLKKL